MTADQKFSAGADLFAEACYWMKAGIARSLPDASPAEREREVERRLRIDRMLGK